MAETLGDNGEKLERCALTEDDEGQLEVLLGFKVKKRMGQVEEALFKGNWHWVNVDEDTWNETTSRAYFVRDHHRMSSDWFDGSREKGRASKATSTMGKKAQKKGESSIESGQSGANSAVSRTSAVSSTTLVAVDRGRGNARKSKPHGQMASTTVVGPAQLTAASAGVAQMPDASDTLRQARVHADSPPRRAGQGMSSPLAQRSSAHKANAEMDAVAISANLMRARMGRASGVQQQPMSAIHPVAAELNASPPVLAGSASDQETTDAPDWHLIKDTPTPNAADTMSVAALGSPATTAPSDLAVDASIFPSSADGAAAQVGATAGDVTAAAAPGSKKAADDALFLWI